MVMNFNPLLSKRASDIFNVKNFDFFSKEVGDKLIPVVPIIDACNIVRSGIATNVTSQVVYTTPADRDFYLCGYVLSVLKDASATSTYTLLQVYVNGTPLNVASLTGLSTTAQNQTVSNALFYPVKIDRNTAISILNQTNVANVTASANILGYISETSPN